MTKTSFVYDLAEGHNGGGSDLNKNYNKGLGTVIRKAVEYEDRYEEMDSLPKKARGSKGRFGWDRRDPYYRWQLQNRWLHAQVGRHIDDVYSEICKLAKKKHDPASMAIRHLFHSKWDGLNVRAKLEVIDDDGSPRMALVNSDGSHIYDRYVDENTLYVSLDGILSYPDKKELERVAALRKKVWDLRISDSKRVIEIRGHYYFKLKGSWMEIFLSKAMRKPAGKYSWCGDFMIPKCALCKKLGFAWSTYKSVDLFPRIDHYCNSLRILGKKEVQDLLLD